MSGPQAAMVSILALTLVLQAFAPGLRVLVVCLGAGLSCLAATVMGVADTRAILAGVPWDVLVILVTLGLLSQLFAESRLFDRLAVAATRASRAEPRRIVVVFAVGMYLASGVVNNLTALVLVLPVLLVLLRLVGHDQRYLSWTLGVVLVACNLGGAATPIGDFPAILLLGRGNMSFGSYLVQAGPVTAAALAVLLLVVMRAVRPARGLAGDPLAARLSRAVMEALHRRITVRRRLFAPAAIALAGMIVAWLGVPASSGISPDLVCWLGAGAALVACGRAGEGLVRRGVDGEAVLFLLALFVMVGAVARTGLFESAAAALLALPIGPGAQLVVFLVSAALLTGLFSAGPSMAALLEVAEALAGQLPADAVYVGLAMSVCAGSSLFLTAATAGPLAQALTERAGLRGADGEPLRFGFFDFLPVGVLSFAVILAAGLAYAAWALATA